MGPDGVSSRQMGAIGGIRSRRSEQSRHDVSLSSRGTVSAMWIGGSLQLLVQQDEGKMPP